MGIHIVIARKVLTKNCVAVGLALALCSCAGIPKDVIGIDGPTISARDVPGTKMHRIFVATTRTASDDPALMFGPERGALRFAQVDVFVPPSHESGKIERADILPPDPRKDFVALNPKNLAGKKEFISALNSALVKWPTKDRNVLVFIHGFNTSFDGAVFRLAQFINDTGYTGIPVLFTWPSRAKSADYLYDLNSALGSRDELLETFKLVGQANINRGDILAHSMGNLLTMETLRQAALEGAFDKRGRLRYVVLASPDIDVDLFAKQVERLPVDSHEFFILLSRDDKALALSRFLAGGVSRVGGADVETLKDSGVTVVDLTDVKGSPSSHSKFAGSPEIVKALGGVLQSDGSVNTRSEPPAGVKVFRGIVKTATAIPSAVLDTVGNVVP